MASSWCRAGKLNVDFKHFAIEEINYRFVSENPSTSVMIYVRNSQPHRGDVIFQDFYAKSRIPLINIQVKSVDNNEIELNSHLGSVISIFKVPVENRVFL